MKWLNKRFAGYLLWLLLATMGAHTAGADNLSPYMHRQLSEARSLMEAGSWTKAQQQLRPLAQKAKSPYAQALIQQSLGQIALQQDKVAEALTHYSKAYAADALPEATQNQLQHTVAQLHCAVEQWRACQQQLQQWLARVPDQQIKARDHLLLAQAFAATEDWRQVIPPARRALALNSKAPISWHRLLVAAHSHLAAWRRAALAQRQLLQQFPGESREWRRLVALQLQGKDYAAALTSLRIPFARGLLREGRDYRQLAQLMAHEDLPFAAGKVLSEGMRLGKVKATADNLRLLAGLWLQAKEPAKAIAAFKRLLALQPSKKGYRQVALLHYQQMQWREARAALRQAIKLAPDGDLLLLLGMVQTQLRQFDQAKQTLLPLINDDNLRQNAESWLNYIDSLST